MILLYINMCLLYFVNTYFFMKKILYNGFVFPIKIFLFILRFVIFYLILIYIIQPYFWFHFVFFDSVIVYSYFYLMNMLYDFFDPNQYFKLKW